MHVDFLEVSLEDEITVNVPIILRGEAIGQKEGGIVQQVRNDLKVRCLVKNIPEKIEYNIEKLDIGDSLHIRDLNLSGNIIALDNADYTIASVVTIKEEVVAPTITLETAALEPGVAGAEGAPGVETKAGEEDKKESKAKKEAKEEKKDKKEK
jgi:large subunit ribosomal protein L25